MSTPAGQLPQMHLGKGGFRPQSRKWVGGGGEYGACTVKILVPIAGCRCRICGTCAGNSSPRRNKTPQFRGNSMGCVLVPQLLLRESGRSREPGCARSSAERSITSALRMSCIRVRDAWRSAPWTDRIAIRRRPASMGMVATAPPGALAYNEGQRGAGCTAPLRRRAGRLPSPCRRMPRRFRP